MIKSAKGLECQYIFSTLRKSVEFISEEFLNESSKFSRIS